MTLTLPACETPTSPAEDAADDDIVVDAGNYAALKSEAGDPIVITAEGGFLLPESVLYDAEADVYLVSNIGAGPNPLALDDDGFISRIGPDGSVIDLTWIDGADLGTTLHGPFGMTIAGDALYVVDRDALRVFDRETGQPLGAYDIAEQFAVALLNDVCAGPKGELYVTDTGLTLDAGGAFVPTGTDAIYRIEDGTIASFRTGEQLEGPNGCLVSGANVFWTTFKSDRAYRTNSSGKQFLTAELPGGSIDSIVRAGGALFFSSWGAGAVFRTNLAGNAAAIVAEVGTPGDMGYDTKRDRLLVPSVFGNSLVIVPF